MKKLTAVILVLILCLTLSVSAFAAGIDSNQGGNTNDVPKAPQTGSSIVAVLAITACAAGSTGIFAYKKSKEE